MTQKQALPLSVEHEGRDYFANLRNAVKSEADSVRSADDWALINRRRSAIVEADNYGSVDKMLKAAARAGIPHQARATIYRHASKYLNGGALALAPRKSTAGLKTNIGYLPAVYIVTRVADSEYTDSVTMQKELEELAEKIAFEVPSRHKIRRFRKLLSEKIARMMYVDRQEFTRRHNITIDQPLYAPLEWYHSDTTELVIKNYDHATKRTVRRSVFVTWVVDAASGIVIAYIITKAEPNGEDMVRLIHMACQPRHCVEGWLGGVPKNWRFDNAKIHLMGEVSDTLNRLNVRPDFTAVRCPQENSRVEQSFRHLKEKLLYSLQDWVRVKPDLRDMLRYDEVEELIRKHVIDYNFEQPSKGYRSRYHRWVFQEGSRIAEAAKLPAGELELKIGVTKTAKVHKCHVQVDNHHLQGDCLAGFDGQEVIVRHCPGKHVSRATVYRTTDNQRIGIVENPFDRKGFAKEMAENRLDFRKQHMTTQGGVKDISKMMDEIRKGPRKPGPPKPKPPKKPSKAAVAKELDDQDCQTSISEGCF